MFELVKVTWSHSLNTQQLQRRRNHSCLQLDRRSGGLSPRQKELRTSSSPRSPTRWLGEQSHHKRALECCSVPTSARLRAATSSFPSFDWEFQKVRGKTAEQSLIGTGSRYQITRAKRARQEVVALQYRCAPHDVMKGMTEFVK